jgi:ribosomal protein S18 acetylase RimI-like enzyme
MAVQRLQRIAPRAGPSLYHQLSGEALGYVYWRRDLERIERDHAELIIRREGNIIAAQQAGEAKLVYAFVSEVAFVEHFPPMLDQLLPRLRRVLASETVRFRLAHNPARPVVEPVLKKLWFKPTRRWLEFAIDRLPKTTTARARGVKFRDATPDDAEAMARLDLEAFPDTPEPVSSIRARLTSQDIEGVVAVRGRDVVAFCTFAQTDPGEGYVHTLAVASVARRDGIGAALTQRALKRLFTAGADRVSLTTDDDNGPAIRLYGKLGFRQTRAGVDYERPTDPRAIRRIQQEHLGTLIKFGGWR